MKKALILQGWYQKPDTNWYPWLKTELEKKDYQVKLPDLPTIHTQNPDMKTTLNFIEALDFLDENTTLIGHSLGVLIGYRLAEKKHVDKLILVAGWDYNDLTPGHRSFWPKPIDHQAIKDHTNKRIVIHSNDPYTTPFQAEQMAGRLQAEYVYIKNAGHFVEDDGITQIPEILAYI